MADGSQKASQRGAHVVIFVSVNIQTIFLVFLLGLLSAVAAAAPYVPEPLQPWVDWVAERTPERDCPLLAGPAQRACLWISAAELRLTDKHGEFSLSGHSHAPGWLILPGSREHWPRAAALQGGDETRLLEYQGRPALFLQPGPFVVRGIFGWQRLPTALALPGETGLVRLWIDGVATPVNRDQQGRLWLRDHAPADAVQAADRLDLRVHRKFSDQAPMRLDTQLELDVAGAQREVILPAPLLEGFIPIELQSPLPARIEPDGTLRVQLRPGSWSITVSAYRQGEITRLRAPQASNGWPDQEVWAFEAQPQLRLVETSGLSAIDPRQTSLPKAWQGLPAFLAEPGQALQLEPRRRGDAHPEPDTLALQRTLWLDFDGGGYTVQDRLSGTITQAWRLEAGPQLSLGRVAVDGRDQLITQRPGVAARGVEIRRGSLQLVADSRYEGPRDTLPLGWRHDLNSASATLHLPPGWDLLAVSGVDNNPPSWLQRWTLLDLFLVLIAALAVARLWGVMAGALALAALALSWHAPGAPQQVWLHLIAALALLRVVPAGRLRLLVAMYRNLALIALLLIAVPFLLDQARTALYPQLGDARQQQSYPPAHPAAARPATAERRSVLADQVVGLSQGIKGGHRGSYSGSYDYQRIDPSANVQTGPGLPRWQWRQLQLGWNGPVSHEQRVSLTLLSPWQNRAIHALRILLLLALAATLLRDRQPGGPAQWLRALKPQREDRPHAQA